MTEITDQNPIRLFLHGFTECINNQVGAVASIADGDPLSKLIFKADQPVMSKMLSNWKAAGQPNYAYWYPNTKTFSLGFNL
jgi:hypothetical protein